MDALDIPRWAAESRDMARRQVQSSENQSVDAVVAGGGLVGLTLGIALAEAGLQSAVIDAEPPDSMTSDAYDGRSSAIALPGSRPRRQPPEKTRKSWPLVSFAIDCNRPRSRAAGIHGGDAFDERARRAFGTVGRAGPRHREDRKLDS